MSMQPIEKDLARRLLNVLPAGTYAMHRFLDLVDVTVDEVSPTACVEAGAQPRLHLNKAFLETHCQTDEHLFLLVMHELRHIILGHTSLYPRITPLHNIAFDAIINATLCHEMPGAEYTAFFQAINDTDSTAGRLLRPPADWSPQVHAGEWIKVRSKDVPALYGRKMSARERWLLHRLYYKNPPRVTVQEIVDLLESQAPNAECPGVVLLGDHGRPHGSSAAAATGRQGDADAGALRDAVMKSIMKDMAERWKSAGKARGLGGEVTDFLLEKERDPRRDFLAALRALLQKAGIFSNRDCRSFAWKPVVHTIETRSVIPEWRDRHAAAKEILLDAPPILYQSWVDRKSRRWSPTSESHVYLDISGSMSEELPWLAAALNPLETSGRCRVFVFSTVVDSVRRGRLLVDRVKNTGGTDINCVLEHILSLPKAKMPRKVVVLTDGYTGVPAPKLADQIKSHGIAMYVGLIGTASDYYLRSYAKLIEQLPNPA